MQKTMISNHLKQYNILKNSKLYYIGAIGALLCALLAAACTHDDESDPTVVINIGNTNDTLYPRTNGLLSGLFDIGGSAKVRFAQGNLQYQPSTGKWRLASNQYDCIGRTNSYISPTSDYWIDLFVWGSSGCDTNIPTYFVFNDSSDIQIDSTTFLNINSDYMSPNNQYDWGVFNAIPDAGNLAGWFHTLTSTQWNHLINQRYNARKKRGVAEIEGTKGYVLLPDSWEMPEGCTFVPDSSRDSMATPFVNVYDQEIWQKMEDEGAVFLPYAGRRVGRNIPGVNRFCYYWTASPYRTSRGLINYAALNKRKVSYIEWYYGLAVRLVYYERNEK